MTNGVIGWKPLFQTKVDLHPWGIHSCMAGSQQSGMVQRM